MREFLKAVLLITLIVAVLLSVLRWAPLPFPHVNKIKQNAVLRKQIFPVMDSAAAATRGLARDGINLVPQLKQQKWLVDFFAEPAKQELAKNGEGRSPAAEEEAYGYTGDIPAAVSGFSTMSSAASMPLTIIGAENSAKNKDLARSVIPATVNIHLIGDCFAIPILAYAVLKSFGMTEPSLLSYLTFSLYFVIAKFSVAAIPGGGILVMLPILEAYLGFNAEMMSLITALYVLFDPVITCANVLGNGAFAKLIDRCNEK